MKLLNMQDGFKCPKCGAALKSVSYTDWDTLVTLFHLECTECDWNSLKEYDSSEEAETEFLKKHFLNYQSIMNEKYRQSQNLNTFTKDEKNDDKSLYIYSESTKEVKMNKKVEEILYNEKMGDDEKRKELLSLIESSKQALEFLNGDWKFCQYCKEYYKAKSFYNDSAIIKKQVCVYEDPINSGGNEWEEKDIKVDYIICPKGHKDVVNEEEIK